MVVGWKGKRDGQIVYVKKWTIDESKYMKDGSIDVVCFMPSGSKKDLYI